MTKKRLSTESLSDIYKFFFSKKVSNYRGKCFEIRLRIAIIFFRYKDAYFNQNVTLVIHFFYICRTMIINFPKYASPKTEIIDMLAEQCFLTASGLGSNEELLEDPNDYIDFFE